MPDPAETFELVVEDVFTITGRGVVIIGPFVGNLPHTGDRLILIGDDEQPLAVTCTGVEMLTRSVDGHLRTDGWGIVLDGVERPLVHGQKLRPAP